MIKRIQLVKKNINTDNLSDDEAKKLIQRLALKFDLEVKEKE